MSTNEEIEIEDSSNENQDFEENKGWTILEMKKQENR